MSILRHIIICILLISGILLPVTAVGQVKVHGKITDTKGGPIEFATVRVEGTAVGTTSGSDGDYSLSCAMSDTITIIFSCIGYREEKRRLVGASGEVALNMRMQFDSEMLQQVEVAELKKQTGSIAIIDASQLRSSPDVSGGSVESLITTMAGVNSSNEMSSQYSVRGGSYDENSVYINDIEIYRPQLVSAGQQEGMSIVNPDLVGSIGFSTGGYPAEYGDKMSSVLDITYRELDSFEGSLTGSLMGGALSLGQGSNRFSQLHGVRYKSASSLLSSMDTKGEYDPRYFDYQTFLTYKFSDRLKGSFLGNISINNYVFTPVNRTTTFGTSMDARQFTVYFDGQEKDRFETYLGALSLEYRVNRGTALRLVASSYLTNELVAYDISGEYWLDQAGTSDIGGELGVGRYREHARNRLKASVMSFAIKGESAINPRHTLGYGVGIQRECVMDRSREWELRDSAGFSIPVSPTELSMVYSLDSKHDVSSLRFTAFLQDAWRLSTSAGFVTVNAGVRMCHWSFNKETLVSPRVSVGFIPEEHPGWAFRFATGLYYQSPFYKEYRMAVADGFRNQSITLNKDIRSQQSVHIITGTDYTFRALGRPFKLSGEVYYKKMSDLVPYEIDNLKLVYSGMNESSGCATGIDMKLFGQFVPGSDSWISFSLMKTRETLHGINVPRPTDRGYSLGIFFTDYFPKIRRLKFALRGVFMQGLPSTAPRSTRDEGYFRMPPYKRVDVGLQYALLSPVKDGESRSGVWRWLKSVWLGIDMFNLLDISNVASYYWVTDVNDVQYAVPNYLTRRQFNIRLSVDF
ncbi:carboxypeptidase-like regulatory domain-containing protein [uncultured Duncaniella sp.]|uniref:TonB-dependent receptor n=2 Tax=uncultured Duncaniella sp. TaxID=2768039 RepID=UPI0025B1E216|nr:carboxypeptidase-like regulatory domain-containing protein [uncultured Duncaniella sp.]